MTVIDEWVIEALFGEDRRAARLAVGRLVLALMDQRQQAAACDSLAQYPRLVGEQLPELRRLMVSAADRQLNGVDGSGGGNGLGRDIAARFGRWYSGAVGAWKAVTEPEGEFPWESK
jgi:hypothetical protein